MLSRRLTIAPDGTLPACWTVRSQVSSQDDLKHTLEHALKYTPNCTLWHTPSLLNYSPPSKLTRSSQVHSEYIRKYTPGHAPKDALTGTRWHTPSLLDCTFSHQLSRSFQAHSQLHSMTLPACMTIRSQVSSQAAPKYTPSMFSSTLPGMLSRTLLIALDGTLLACLALRSQVHSQEARHSQSHLTICSHVCSWVLDPETCWVAGARHPEAGGEWWVAEIMMSVYIIVWTLFLAWPPRRDLTMPHGYGVDNCSLRFCTNGRQLDIRESRSPTQIFQRNLLAASHRWRVYVCVFGLGLMVTMAMVMMAMVMMAMVMIPVVMVSVTVIIVPEALRQVGWLRQR